MAHQQWPSIKTGPLCEEYLATKVAHPSYLEFWDLVWSSISLHSLSAHVFAATYATYVTFRVIISGICQICLVKGPSRWRPSSILRTAFHARYNYLHLAENCVEQTMNTPCSTRNYRTICQYQFDPTTVVTVVPIYANRRRCLRLQFGDIAVLVLFAMQRAIPGIRWRP